MKFKRGVSVVTLIITMVIMLILSGAVILATIENNPINNTYDSIDLVMKRNLLEASERMETDNIVNKELNIPVKVITIESLAELINTDPLDITSQGYSINNTNQLIITNQDGTIEVLYTYIHSVN